MTRQLTQTEIDEILDFIVPRPGIPLDTARAIADNLKAKLTNQLAGQKRWPSDLTVCSNRNNQP